jgi:hypothetical protein
MPKKTFRRGKGGKNSKKQKVYNMKGCSKSRNKCKSRKLVNRKLVNRKLVNRKLVGGQGCGAYGCPLAPFSWKQMQQRGGDCSVTQCAPILGTAQTGGTCGCDLSMKGGSNFYKPAEPIPGPFIGKIWTPSISGWPGVDGIGSNRNYLANNLYNAGDPQTMMKLGGSKRRKGIKGGGLMPQDLVNLGRDVSFNFKSAYNALNGYSAPTNPMPYKDQLSDSISANRIIV